MTNPFFAEHLQMETEQLMSVGDKLFLAVLVLTAVACAAGVVWAVLNLVRS